MKDAATALPTRLLPSQIGHLHWHTDRHMSSSCSKQSLLHAVEDAGQLPAA